MYNKKSKRSDSYEKAKEKAAEVAATTACLFFGCVDAATTISQSCGGGGCGNNDLPHRKDDEDDLAFARRCHQAAKTMILGSHKRGYHR